MQLTVGYHNILVSWNKIKYILNDPAFYFSPFNSTVIIQNFVLYLSSQIFVVDFFPLTKIHAKTNTSDPNYTELDPLCELV